MDCPGSLEVLRSSWFQDASRSSSRPCHSRVRSKKKPRPHPPHPSRNFPSSSEPGAFHVQCAPNDLSCDDAESGYSPRSLPTTVLQFLDMDERSARIASPSPYINLGSHRWNNASNLQVPFLMKFNLVFVAILPAVARALVPLYGVCSGTSFFIPTP